jgi:hypothetical protein
MNTMEPSKSREKPSPGEFMRQKGGVLRLFRDGQISLKGPQKARSFALGWRKNPKHLVENEWLFYSHSTMLSVGLDYLAYAARRIHSSLIILDPSCGPEAPGRWFVLVQNDPVLSKVEVRF